MPKPAVTLSDLHGDPQNARRHNSRNIEQVQASLQAYGAARSIVIDEDNQIIAGHGVVEAAVRAGIERVQVVDGDGETIIAVRRSGLTRKQKQGLGIADNRASELAEWDADVLAGLKDEIDLEQFWQKDELDAILRDVGGSEVDAEPQVDKADELRQKWGTATGQLWQAGEHRLLCGDSTKAEDVARVMGGERAGAVVTDPPYGMGLDTDWSDTIGALGSLGAKSATHGNKYEPVIGDDKPFDPSPLFALWPVQEMFLFGADYYSDKIPNREAGSWLVWDKRKESQSEAIGAEFELVWSKQKHKRRVLRFDWFGFLSSSAPKEARDRVHPTQKPTPLIEFIIREWCKGDVIADPYLGSGTTLIACERLGRKCRAIEISPGYVAVTLERWATATGKTPARVD